jgi:hypothetical protein
VSDFFYSGCNNISTIVLTVCETLGSSVGYDYVFFNIIGKTITLTIPSSLMACNGGNPDGDIQYLIDNNTVTIYDPDGNVLYPYSPTPTPTPTDTPTPPPTDTPTPTPTDTPTPTNTPLPNTITMSTNSVNSAWKIPYVSKTGGLLSWEVSGAVRYISTGNTPVFNFNTPGTKYITITSSDNLSGLTYLNCISTELLTLDVNMANTLNILACSNNNLTTLNISNLINLNTLSCGGNQLSTLNVNGLTNLTNIICDHNQLTTLNVSGLTNLTNIGCNNNQLTTIDLTDNYNLTDLNCNYNSLTVTTINDVLDKLIAFHVYGNYCYLSHQTPIVYGDVSKVNSLKTRWINVIIDVPAPTPTPTATPTDTPTATPTNTPTPTPDY